MKFQIFTLTLLMNILVKSQFLTKQQTHQIVQAYVDYTLSHRKGDLDLNTEILGLYSESTHFGYTLNVTILNTRLLTNFKYSQLYSFGKYSLVMGEETSKYQFLKKMFPKKEFKDLNQGTFDLNYTTKDFYIGFDKQSRILFFLPHYAGTKTEAYLKKKKFKFSPSYKEEMAKYADSISETEGK